MLGGSADRLCTPSTSSGPFRLFAIPGFQNRTNDVVYCPPLIRQPHQNVEDSTAIVYFGGDVQDFPESMETNRDSRSYMKYNLENSAILLREAFPLCHVLVIRPVRMEFKTFSCFDNFVRGNNAGVPDHTPMNHALHHLEKLLQNVTHRLLSIPENEILDQAEQAAAATAAVAAAAAATAASIATHASENNQEMDIDILQVQENVSADNESAVIIPNSDKAAAAIANHVSEGKNTISSSSNNSTSVSASTTNTITTKHSSHNAQHFNNVNNSNNSSSSSSSSSNSNSSKNNNANDEESVVHTTATTTATTTTSTQQQRKNQLLQQQQIQHQQQQTRLQQNHLWWRENLNLDKSKLILIGFSKGCVVLNQFIYEFHYLKTLTPDDSSMIRLLTRFKEMYWLDGGHGGQKNTWITARSLLETLTRMGMNIHVHLTPYQVQDDRRPWIRKEEKIFTDLLRRLGAPLSRHLHFEAQPSNLMTHFEVLQAFCLHVHQQQQQLRQQNANALDTNQMPVMNALNAEHISAELQQQQQQQQLEREATAIEQLTNNSIGTTSNNISAVNIANLSRTDMETNSRNEK